MFEIYKHGNRFYQFRCINCGCEFGTTKVCIALNKENRSFAYAGAECPECSQSCICKEENKSKKEKQ